MMRIAGTIVLCLLAAKVSAQWNTAGTNIYSANSGNVGIGIDAPLEKLHVDGSVRGNADGGALRISTATGWLDMGSMNANWTHLQTDRPKFYFNKSIYVDGALSSYNTLNLDLQTDGTTRMTIESTSGYVGIGTTTPKQALHVKGRIYLEGTEAYPNGWLQNYFHWRGHSLIMGTEAGQYTHNKVELKPGGSTSGVLESMLEVYRAISPTEHQLKIMLQSNGHSFFNGGNVGIGTETPDAKLTVKGTIHTEEVKVDLNGALAPDYVFDDDYDLRSLGQLQAYISVNRHLPEVPSAEEMEQDGMNLKEMNLLLLKKVEELTLYMIGQNRRLESQQQQIELQKELLEEQSEDIKNLKKRNQL